MFSILRKVHLRCHPFRHRSHWIEGIMLNLWFGGSFFLQALHVTSSSKFVTEPSSLLQLDYVVLSILCLVHCFLINFAISCLLSLFSSRTHFFCKLNINLYSYWTIFCSSLNPKTIGICKYVLELVYTLTGSCDQLSDIFS